MPGRDQPVSFQLHDGGHVAVPAMVEVLDLQAARPGVRRLRAWAREVLRPRPGERAVDVGAGTGEETQALATAVGPSGVAIGLEPNPGLRAVAARRAAQARSTARFAGGDVRALPFNDSTVDLVRCERVFQHLDDPDRAATEIARVLRPDGRVMVSDSDWSTMILRPGEQATVDAVRRFWLGQFPNPRSGQRLYGQLTAAGLVVDQTCPPGSTKDASGAESLINRLINVEGLLPDDQRDRLLADLRAGVDRGDFHFSVTMFAVLAHKPGQCGRL